MKLSKIALLAVRGLPIEDKKLLATACGVTLQTLYHKIRLNEVNGILTKAIAVETIANGTGIRQEEILEKDSIESNGLEIAKVQS